MGVSQQKGGNGPTLARSGAVCFRVFGWDLTREIIDPKLRGRLFAFDTNEFLHRLSFVSGRLVDFHVFVSDSWVRMGHLAGLRVLFVAQESQGSATQLPTPLWRGFPSKPTTQSRPFSPMTASCHVVTWQLDTSHPHHFKSAARGLEFSIFVRAQRVQSGQQADAVWLQGASCLARWDCQARLTNRRAFTA